MHNQATSLREDGEEKKLRKKKRRRKSGALGSRGKSAKLADRPPPACLWLRGKRRRRNYGGEASRDKRSSRSLGQQAQPPSSPLPLPPQQQRQRRRQKKNERGERDVNEELATKEEGSHQPAYQFAAAAAASANDDPPSSQPSQLATNSVTQSAFEFKCKELTDRGRKGTRGLRDNRSASGISVHALSGELIGWMDGSQLARPQEPLTHSPARFSSLTGRPQSLPHSDAVDVLRHEPNVYRW